MVANPIDLSRRNLFKGRLSGASFSDIRPPWAVGDEFEARCTRCGDCLRHCPEGILATGDGGYPIVDFTKGSCTFCADCVKACSPQALDRGVGAPWAIKATVTAACLSSLGISCRSCGDVCAPRALRFRLQLGGRAKLEIERGFCTGCGACLAVCPVQAIQLREALHQPLARLEGAA